MKVLAITIEKECPRCGYLPDDCTCTDKDMEEWDNDSYELARWLHEDRKRKQNKLIDITP